MDPAMIGLIILFSIAMIVILCCIVMCCDACCPKVIERLIMGRKSSNKELLLH